ENVVKHCGIASDVEVRVRVWEEQQTINVRVSNSVSALVVTQEARDGIDGIMKDMARGNYSQYVPKEGLSGFYKIRKILEHDLRSLEVLEFGFGATNEFVVTFSIQKG